jgi:Secretion system C-terminal sorting domain
MASLGKLAKYSYFKGVMKSATKFLLLLLVLHALAGAAVWGQVVTRPFVKKFETGYPNFSYFTSIWPTDTGWWGLFTKFDSLGTGMYYYGAEAVVMDSSFDITSRVNHGNSTRYYTGFPELSRKTIPDEKGNFWYWLRVYTRPDSLWHLVYGKMNQTGQILFEGEISNTTQYDYFFQFLPLPTGGGVSINTHRGRFTYVTWLHWVDSLGNITHFDSTQRITSNYLHETNYCTYDSIRNQIIAPSRDFYLAGSEISNIRPRISVYSFSGALILQKDLTPQLQNNAIGSIYPLINGGYAAFVMEYVHDSTAASEDHRPGIVKLDSNFDVVWKKYLFPLKFNNYANDFYQSPKGDFYLTGSHDSCPSDTCEKLDWYVTKFSPNLDSLWTRFFNLGEGITDDIIQNPTQIQTMPNGDILINVQNYGFWPPLGHGINYTTLYKLDSMGCLIGGCAIGDTIVVPPDTINPPPPDTLYLDPSGGIIAYPNPNAGQFAIAWDVNPGDRATLRVSDVAGRVLLSQAVVRRAQPTLLDLRDWAAGVYLVEVTSERGRVFRTRVSVLR